MGAELVAVTLGPRGALLRGAVSADAPGSPAQALDTTGAGDVVTGVLVAALAPGDLSAAAGALPIAVRAAAARDRGMGRDRRAPGRDRAPVTDGWRSPSRARMRAVRDRLRGYYGRPRNEPHRAPLDELVLTVLSQNTNDRNRDVAYERLRSRFPDWQAVAAAPVEEVEEAIRPGGISKVKSLRIKAMLASIEAETGSLDLGFLARRPRETAIGFLERLPGVGRKTAACVLLFAFDRPEMPVDTHVYRVSSRLGLIRPRASFEEAHDLLRERTDDADMFELHVNLIRHGRRLCTARNPACRRCPLLPVCPHGKRATGRAR